MRSNLQVLIAQKSQREGTRLSLRGVAAQTGISTYTIYKLASNELNEFPRDVIEKLCTFFDCGVGDLLHVEEAPPTE